MSLLRASRRFRRPGRLKVGTGDENGLSLRASVLEPDGDVARAGNVVVQVGQRILKDDDARAALDGAAAPGAECFRCVLDQPFEMRFLPPPNGLTTASLPGANRCETDAGSRGGVSSQPEKQRTPTEANTARKGYTNHLLRWDRNITEPNEVERRPDAGRGRAAATTQAGCGWALRGIDGARDGTSAREKGPG